MTFEVSYSRLDKALHRMAFGGTGLQISLADIEDRVFSAKEEPNSVESPVFVTSLPRAGTTLLLEVLVGSGEFATHTYREMPFVLCPQLWSMLSTRFRTAATQRTRAHGDGMTVDYDSPEAFEEIIWKAFWPNRFDGLQLSVWKEPDAVFAEFESFFRSHQRKMVSLRNPTGKNKVRRYISKNNGNVSRVKLILEQFPDAKVVIPFRSPLEHANSMWTQHTGFVRMQQEDPFVLSYMSDLGHFDFGSELKPINFGGWLDTNPDESPAMPRFWLEYWVAAFEEIMAISHPRLLLVSYDQLCTTPAEILPVLAKKLGLDPDCAEALTAQAARFRVPRTYEGDSFNDEKLVSKAMSTFEKLQSAAVRSLGVT